MFIDLLYFDSFLRTIYEFWRHILQIKGAAQGFNQLPRRRQPVTILRRSMCDCGGLFGTGHAKRTDCRLAA